MVKPLTPTEQTNLNGFQVSPHPDGQPWPKCCGDKAEKGLTGNCPVGGEFYRGCTCLMRKPQNGPSRYEYHQTTDDPRFIRGRSRLAQLEKEGGRFFCVHRTDGQYHRECAGWAAKFKHGAEHDAK